jgi:O-antigen/teichoic acid export membrane protein
VSKRPFLVNQRGSQAKLIFHNLSANYIVAGIELLIGVFMLPFNLAYLGPSAYGLWALLGSIKLYFSMLEAGYGFAQVKFAAKYRAQGDTKAINEIASTMFCVFSAIGVLTLCLAILLAFNLQRIFPLTPEQVNTGRIVFLFISAYVALGFPISVFGGIVNGFQRTYLNGIVAAVTAVVVAAINVAVLMSGYGLVELVAATTVARIISYFAYALNAYRVFPELRIRVRYFSRDRLRELTAFSVFVFLIDLANKLNYSTDTIVIGAFMGTAAVAMWTVAQRLIEIVQRVTDQLNSVLFPVVVDSSTGQHTERLQNILLQGTRLSLAMVVPLATVLGLLAKPVVITWVGPDFAPSVPILHVLSIAVALRVGSATSTVVLKGAGHHRLLAISNITTALCNLVLSIVLVRRYGLLGVAWGTLVPMLVIPTLVLVPAACRRVSISPVTLLRESVWPAVWPAIAITIFLIAMRGTAQVGWVSLILQAGCAGLIYAAIFFRFAISREEREWYFVKAKEIFG